MNLALDIGNTNVKAAVFNGNGLVEVCVQQGELIELLRKYPIENAIVSKTGENSEVEERLADMAVKVMQLNNNLRLPIDILYKTPHTLGADRVAGSVAANAEFPNEAVLKIDFGTCITYDVVNADNQYLGGAISPGMMMRFKAMHSYTAKLPLVDPMQYTKFELTGTDTASAIASGVVNGIKNEVGGIINNYKQRFGNLKVVATGGDSGLFVTLIKSEIFARPYLVLQGLNHILNYNLK